jgi:hypothetical protein
MAVLEKPADKIYYVGQDGESNFVALCNKCTWTSGSWSTEKEVRRRARRHFTEAHKHVTVYDEPEVQQ